MGFTTPKISAPETVTAAPPVVSESTAADAGDNYGQQASRRKGLLSTILSNRRQEASANTSHGNSTLG